jgi:hypothetical protein
VDHEALVNAPGQRGHTQTTRLSFNNSQWNSLDDTQLTQWLSPPKVNILYSILLIYILYSIYLTYIYNALYPDLYMVLYFSKFWPIILCSNKSYKTSIVSSHLFLDLYTYNFTWHIYTVLHTFDIWHILYTSLLYTCNLQNHNLTYTYYTPYILPDIYIPNIYNNYTLDLSVLYFIYSWLIYLYII